MLEILFRIQPTARHQGIGDTDGGSGLKLDFDVVIIVLRQERTVNDIAEISLMIVPIPVSYTHLDVYKRQVLLCGPLCLTQLAPHIAGQVFVGCYIMGSAVFLQPVSYTHLDVYKRQIDNLSCPFHHDMK